MVGLASQRDHTRLNLAIAERRRNQRWCWASEYQDASSSAQKLDKGTGKTRKERISINAAWHSGEREKKARAPTFSCLAPTGFGSEGATVRQSTPLCFGDLGR